MSSSSNSRKKLMDKVAMTKEKLVQLLNRIEELHNDGICYTSVCETICVEFDTKYDKAEYYYQEWLNKINNNYNNEVQVERNRLLTNLDNLYKEAKANGEARLCLDIIRQKSKMLGTDYVEPNAKFVTNDMIRLELGLPLSNEGGFKC